MKSCRNITKPWIYLGCVPFVKFFLPFWNSDRIDSTFDPITETWTGKGRQRIWDVFSKRVPFDGILVSRSNLNNNVLEGGKTIHQTLGFQGAIMGDCGAFQYLKDPDPAYDPLETLKFYKRLKFDLGVTVDHIVLTNRKYEETNPAENDYAGLIELARDDGMPTSELVKFNSHYRYELTIQNAKTMFDEWSSNPGKLELIGAVQGWSPSSIASAALDLVEYGFDHIGLGGLVRVPTKGLKQIIKTVCHEIRMNVRKRVKIHLFGIGRPDLFSLMEREGITSFDCAGELRKAWLSGNKNYAIDGKYYKAIRIPLSKNLANRTNTEYYRRIIELENAALKSLRQFPDSNNVDHTIKVVKE